MNRNLFLTIPFALCLLFLSSCKKESITPELANGDAVALQQSTQDAGNTFTVTDRTGCLYRLNLYSGRIDVWGFGGVGSYHDKYCNGVSKKAYKLKTYYIAPNEVVLSTPMPSNNLIRIVAKQNGTYCCLTPVDASGNQIGGSICINLNNTQTYDLLVNQSDCAILIDNCGGGG